MAELSPVLFFCVAVLLLGTTTDAANTWATCSGGDKKSYCTDVLSTKCCSDRGKSSAKCCSPTVCSSTWNGPKTTCMLYSQSMCCPDKYGGSHYCCNSDQYKSSIFLSSNWRYKVDQRHSSSSVSSRRSELYSLQRRLQREFRSAQASTWTSSFKSSITSASSWNSYSWEIWSSLYYVTRDAKKAYDGACAAGGILGILILILIVTAVLFCRSSAEASNEDNNTHSAVATRNESAGNNQAFTPDPDAHESADNSQAFTPDPGSGMANAYENVTGPPPTYDEAKEGTYTSCL